MSTQDNTITEVAVGAVVLAVAVAAVGLASLGVHATSAIRAVPRSRYLMSIFM